MDLPPPNTTFTIMFLPSNPAEPFIVLELFYKVKHHSVEQVYPLRWWKKD